MVVLRRHPTRARNAGTCQQRHALAHLPGQIETDEQPHAGGTSASSFSTSGSRRATMCFTPSTSGCRPSGWLSDRHGCHVLQEERIEQYTWPLPEPVEHRAELRRVVRTEVGHRIHSAQQHRYMQRRQPVEDRTSNSSRFPPDRHRAARHLPPAPRWLRPHPRQVSNRVVPVRRPRYRRTPPHRRWPHRGHGRARTRRAAPRTRRLRARP